MINDLVEFSKIITEHAIEFILEFTMPGPEIIIIPLNPPPAEAAVLPIPPPVPPVPPPPGPPGAPSDGGAGGGSGGGGMGGRK